LKLIVIIPAYNEEESLLEVIGEVPREIEGIDSVEVLVIDDGSMDRTTDMAQKAGAIVFHHKKNQGLAIAFRTGLIMALKRGADIIVNIDADGQYNGKEIPRIIKPVLDGEADVVLTDRQVLERSHMPFGKKYGNIIATHVTRFTSGFAVRDAQSGFRAFSREAALRLNILGSYTYVQETIIDAAAKRLSIVQVPCEFRARRGKSRLISNIFSYAKRAGSLIIRTYIHHRPLKVFLSLGSFIFVLGVLTGARFLYF
jgi:glycosyltransferase involved in cell wall biosynthesis